MVLKIQRASECGAFCVSDFSGSLSELLSVKCQAEELVVITGRLPGCI